MPTTDKKITRTAREALLRLARDRYATADGDERGRILGEFVALSGYHRKYAIGLLNRDETDCEPPRRRVRSRLYDEAARQALIVLWEASDRVCGKRLKALMRILVPSLERHGHLHLSADVRDKVMSMSAATIDRLLKDPKASTRKKRPRHVMPEIRRRIPVRTFADWKDPGPGSMEMDLVAHCGDVNQGSYVHSLVLTDIASGWTECAPLVVRERTLLTEALERIRVSLPFRLRALDVDNGGEFVNETLIGYCISHGIELTRSRPYRKNDQAWIEQKNGAVVRRMVGYRRLEGIAAAQRLARLYAATRFFVNFFQPSFKLSEKTRTGAQVTRRYLTPQTPCERLLSSTAVNDVVKNRLREVVDQLDPLQLLEEIRTVQGHLVAHADGAQPYEPTVNEPDLAAFLAGLTTAWHGGEVRPTHLKESGSVRVLRRIQLPASTALASLPPSTPVMPSARTVDTKPGQGDSVAHKTPSSSRSESLRLTDTATDTPMPTSRHRRRPHGFESIWPLICQRLEARPNLNASELLDQLRVEYPGRYTLSQLATLQRRLKKWRTAAAARGIVTRPLKHRSSGLPRTYRTRKDPFERHWPELCLLLEADPDQTGVELFDALRTRYPDHYMPGHLRTLQRRVQIWRRNAARALVFHVQDHLPALGLGTLGTSRLVVGDGAAAPSPTTRPPDHPSIPSSVLNRPPPPATYNRVVR